MAGSYGNQLRNLGICAGDDRRRNNDDDLISGKFANRLCQIASHCTNLEMKAELERDVYFGNMNTVCLNPHVRELFAELKTDDANWEDFGHIANGLKKLKKFSCHDFPVGPVTHSLRPRSLRWSISNFIRRKRLWIRL